MQLDELFAMDNPREVHPAAGQELDRRGQHRGEGRNRLQPIFVDERKLLLVHRIGAEPDAEGVEQALLVGPGDALFLGGEIQDRGIGDGQGRALRVCAIRRVFMFARKRRVRRFAPWDSFR